MRVTITALGNEPPADGSCVLSSLQELEVLAGVPVKVERIQGGTRIDWAIPVSAP